MSAERQEISVTVQELVSFLLRGAVFAVLLAASVGAAVYVVTDREPPVYRAEATLLVARGVAGYTQFGLSPVTAPPIDLAAYRVAAASDRVLTDALRSMGVAEPTASEVRFLRSSVGTTIEAGNRDSSLLRIEGRGEMAPDAVARANAVAAALVAWDRNRATESMFRVIATLEQQIEALSEQVRSLQTLGDPGAQGQIDGLVRLRAEQQQQLAYARALVASAEGLLSVLQPSDGTVRQIGPRPLQFAAIAALLAVVVAYALALLRVALNTKLRSSDDVAAVSGLPVLAEIPTASRQDDSRLREASSYLRTNLLFATEGVHPRAFMVTSTVENEGKTSVSRHLAESFVRYGYHTLLVDADLRTPTLIDAYDVTGGRSAPATTAAWLSDPTGSHQVLSVDLGESGHLDVIPQFEPIVNAPEVLGRGFRMALAQWQDYDVIVVDTPPVLAVADPLTIAPHCSGTILVVDRKRSDRRKLEAAVGALQRNGVQLLGIVANNVGAVGSGGAGYGAAHGSRPPHTTGTGAAGAVTTVSAATGRGAAKRG